jgi:hypothetical protein
MVGKTANIEKKLKIKNVRQLADSGYGTQKI